jgi:hypothetical protein
MRWEFDAAGEWEAKSCRLDEDDQNLIWRIQVCDDGTFSVNASDCELKVCKETFRTLQAAKDYCEWKESRLIVSSTDQIAELIPGARVVEPGVMVVEVNAGLFLLDDPQQQGQVQSAAAWFNKTVYDMASKDVRKVVANDGQ